MNKKAYSPNLPYELLAEIFTIASPSPSQLVHLALVHSSWTSAALDLLYRHITVRSTAQATKLVRRSIRHRFRNTVSLRVYKWILDLAYVVMACMGLNELSLGQDCVGVSLNLLRYPALNNLKSLTLYCSFEEPPPHSKQLSSFPATYPTQLSYLKLLLSPTIKPVVHDIVKASLSLSVPTLRVLHLVGGYEHIALVLPLATIITSFQVGDIRNNASTKHVSEFFQHASKLSQLELSCPYSEGLSQILKSLKCQLRTLVLRLPQGEVFNDNILIVVREEFKKEGSSLSRLESLKFWASLEEMEELAEWCILMEVCEERQIVVSVRS